MLSEARIARQPQPTRKEPDMSPRKPALDPHSLEPLVRSSYPEPYRSRVLPREKRRLGDAVGLTRIGINHTILPPGKESSMRHWHTHEDEFVYVLEGEVVLRTDAGEQLLTAGMCAGFPAGVADGHQLINRGTVPAVYLEVSNRDGADSAYYSDADVDLMWVHGKPLRRDGTPV
jgi:uncharacterized cupin superfamily protein